MITLQNKSQPPRPFVCNLDHKSYCEKAGTCGCKEEEMLLSAIDPTTGTRGIRYAQRKVCATLRILAGRTSDPLHEAVLEVPTVKAAIRSNWLRVVRADKVEANPSPDPDPDPTPEEESPSEEIAGSGSGRRGKRKNRT